MKKEFYLSRNSRSNNPDTNGATSTSYAKSLLTSDTKTIRAFDLLAEKINFYLDYPIILVENGIRGIATLDLYFDNNGNIDESLSKFFGSNRSVRGLLVKAARLGLVKWYLADSFLLKKEQFKNQHFRAEFIISYTLDSRSEIQKSSSGLYTFLRRHYLHQCAQPTGVDVACVAARIYGFARSKVSSSYRIELEALKDQLEHYDNLGLSGITKQIKGA